MVEFANKSPAAQRRFGDVGRGELSKLYALRSWIYVRSGQARQALDDANKAVELSPTPDNLNARAYARAILNVELTDGLTDIQKALDEYGGADPELLDTRGYLLHLLNRNDEALDDLQRTIDMLLKARRYYLNDQIRQAEVRRSLAVMYHHRGLIYQQLGQKENADRDLGHGERLGYNPAAGVF